MKTIFKALLCFGFLFALSCGGGDKKTNETPEESVEETVEESVDEGTTDMNFEVEDAYKCPMDCEDGKEYNEEGSCPVCGMELKHVDEEAHNNSDGHEEKHEEEEHEEEGKTENDLSKE